MAYELDEFDGLYTEDTPLYFKKKLQKIRSTYKRCDKGSYYTIGLALLINQCLDSWKAAISQNTINCKILNYISPALGGALIFTIGIFNLVKMRKEIEIKKQITFGTDLGYFKSVPPVNAKLDETKDTPQEVWMAGLNQKATM